ncbi:MAG: pyruvate kinase [Acidobacteria bacterium]|nr:pyruvate kinase [Acidobacteriota bacterium]
MTAERRAKIVSTFGPACREPDRLREVLAAGTDVVRLNMSHGTPEGYSGVIAEVRKASDALGRPIGILVDLGGPKLRTGRLQGGRPVRLEAGNELFVTAEPIAGDARRISISQPDLLTALRPGHRILIDDGMIELVVVETGTGGVRCRIVHGGELNEQKGFNVPGADLPVPSLTEKDEIDLSFGIEAQVDYLSLSFVRTAADCLRVKELIRKAGADIPLIAKIEKGEALENLEAIIEVSDGVMVARGDLGVEISVESVPVAQKRIIRRANSAEKMVITATQMLQSMIHNFRPTRAEASDVANAILDGTDAVMLSGETAVGEFPVESVRTMGRIIETTEEAGLRQTRLMERLEGRQTGSYGRATAEAAVFASQEMSTRLIVVFTAQGNMPRHVSSIRPRQRIIALTPHEVVERRMTGVWGVEPLLLRFPPRTDELLRACDALLTGRGLAAAGERVVLLAGHIPRLGLSNTMKVHIVGQYD